MSFINQKVIYIFIGILIVTTLIGCGLETKTLVEFYEKDLADVSEIEIFDGNTGYKKIVTDENTIDAFLDEIKDIKFIPQENQEDRSGFNFGITLFQDNEEAFTFGANEVNGDYYYTEPDILPIIDEFYERLNVKEE